MTFEVETASLKETTQFMESELEEIGKIAQRLYSALEALDGMWVGAAHDTFAAQYESDQSMLHAMYKQIGEVIQGMDEARKTYEQCEESVKTEIKKIAV